MVSPTRKMDLEPAVDLIIVVDARAGPDAAVTASLAADDLFNLRF